MNAFSLNGFSPRVLSFLNSGRNRTWAQETNRLDHQPPTPKLTPETSNPKQKQAQETNRLDHQPPTPNLTPKISNPKQKQAQETERRVDEVQ